MIIKKVEYKQRAYDGRWMKLGQVFDYDNSYSYFLENKQKITMVPFKWIILNVYDYELEIVD